MKVGGVYFVGRDTWYSNEREEDELYIHDREKFIENFKYCAENTNIHPIHPVEE